MTDLAVLNCRQLVTLAGPPGARSGPAMGELAILADGALHVRDGRIAAVYVGLASKSSYENDLQKLFETPAKTAGAGARGLFAGSHPTAAHRAG